MSYVLLSFWNSCSGLNHITTSLAFGQMDENDNKNNH